MSNRDANNDGIQELEREYSRMRMALFVSVLLFLTALFALISHWKAAYILIIVSCAFYFGVLFWLRNRYKKTFQKVLLVNAAGKYLKDTSWIGSRIVNGDILVELGLTPNLEFAQKPAMYNSFEGNAGSVSVKAGEAAFVRMSGGKITGSVPPLAGILYSTESVFPGSGEWLILYKKPYNRKISDFEFPQGLKDLSGDADSAFQYYVRDEDGYPLEKVIKALRRSKKEYPFALSMKDGHLSMFIPGVFYSIKPEYRKRPDVVYFSAYEIPALNVMKDAVTALSI